MKISRAGSNRSTSAEPPVCFTKASRAANTLVWLTTRTSPDWRYRGRSATVAWSTPGRPATAASTSMRAALRGSIGRWAIAFSGRPYS